MRRVLKWIGIGIGGLIALIIVVVGVVYAITSQRLGKSYSTQVESVAVAADSVSIERGRHLAWAVGKCVDCHGENLAGKLMADDPIFARLAAANLTSGRGGVGTQYTDQDWVRAIRYGVGRDGKPLIFMPSEASYHFSDADLGAIIAYLKTVPAVDATHPDPRIGPIARMLFLTQDFPLIPAELVPHGGTRPAPVAIGVTPEYGKYLLDAGGCTTCHSPSLAGGAKIGGVAAANLTPRGLGGWTEADFARALREGVRPDGRILSAAMPYAYTRYLTDDEIRAQWLYLQSLPPRETGT